MKINFFSVRKDEMEYIHQFAKKYDIELNIDI